MLSARWRDRCRLGVLALVAFVLAHDLTFLARFGSSYEAVLARTGHGEQWTATVLVMATLATLLAVATVTRLVALGRLARRLDAGTIEVRDGGIGGLAGRALRAWLFILPIALAVFVIVENIEHASAGLPLPGFGVFDANAYTDTPIVFTVVTAIVAFIEGLYRWRRDILVALIRAARARWARSRAATVRLDLPFVERHRGSIAGRRMAGRAPPAFLPA